MSHRVPITRGAWILLGLGAVLAGIGFALPRLHPVPTGLDAELTTLRGERDLLAPNSDVALRALRRQAEEQPPVAWSVEDFTRRVGTGWRVEWQQPDGASRAVLLSRSVPRLHEWPDYHRFAQSWTTQPGVVLESFDVKATGPAQARELGQVVLGLRVVLTDAPISDAERAAPSRGPLPVASATDPATTRKVGPVPALRRPSASAEPPAPGSGSASFRPDPPGPRAGATEDSINPQEKP